MLSRLFIKNFKSIGEEGLNLELKLLTFLVGPNGSGKSSVLEALAFLKESLESNPSEAQRKLGFASLSDIAHRHSNESIRVSVVMNGLSLIRYVISPDGALDVDQTIDAWPVVRPGTVITADDVNRTSQLLRSKIRFKPAKARIEYWDKPDGYELRKRLEKIWSEGDLEAQRSAITKWTSRLGIGSFWVSPRDDRVDYSDLSVRLGVKSMSLGSNQAVPIIVEIADGEPDNIVLIEEPEISLHPEHQVVMAELLASAARENKQVIATTHSTFMLLALTAAVQKEIIKPQDAVIYELEKGVEGTRVKKKLELDEKGVVKGWVDSFSEIEKRLLREWTATLPQV